MTYIVRHARGIPHYPVGHVQQVRRIVRARRPAPRPHALGYNTYHSIAMNACVKESEALAAGWDNAHSIPAP